MTPTRANLDDIGNKPTYIFLTIALLALSAVGIFLFFQIQKTDSTSSPAPSVAPISIYPTAIPTNPEPSLEPFVPSVIPTPQTSLIPTRDPLNPIMEPTPTFKTYTNSTDKFTAVYKSFRKLYIDTEASGNRYTFYSTSGNITVHVGPKWSWVYPDRQFSQSLLVSGYSTFIYETDSQTITDFQVGSQLFTIQCVHQNKADLKTECQQFLSDFKTN